MYTVKVRNSIMIAHSLPHPFFGPAQNMHGATYVVDVTFYSKDIDAHNVVIDIGKAKEVTSEVLSHLNYKNLDELPQFKDKLTTTEFMAKYIHDSIKEKVNAFFEGQISVCLGETHDAWASYSGK
ncbi:6-carboxytetrahydropterin synthase [uncultured Winogradskyella sp.]|uniref:6-pyruvoyl trahydropterin synthase family protein n=1 Tax=uncultured Winogradskyella sp. TaxID=395353 RepID=UPI002625AB9D|nr:6-carboxytetrahydropterin synthase [uncultured Winogradskyella sp.]